MIRIKQRGKIEIFYSGELFLDAFIYNLIIYLKTYCVY